MADFFQSPLDRGFFTKKVGCDYIMYYFAAGEKSGKPELTNQAENGTMTPVVFFHAGIAQSVEQLIRNQQVVSSSLISSSKERKVK